MTSILEFNDLELSLSMTCAVPPPKGKRCQRLVEGLTEIGAIMRPASPSSGTTTCSSARRR